MCMCNRHVIRNKTSKQGQQGLVVLKINRHRWGRFCARAGLGSIADSVFICIILLCTNAHAHSSSSKWGIFEDDTAKLGICQCPYDMEGRLVHVGVGVC